MSAFGLTLDGFATKRLEDIRADLISAFQTEFGSNVRTDDESVNGQLIGVLSERLVDIWELAEAVYLAAYVASSDTAALDDAVSKAGIAREPATFSEVTLTLGGTPGTLIEAGKIAQDPVLGIRWVLLADATIGGGGTIDVLAQPESTGAVLGLAGTITEIVTPVTGWNSVINALDATPGNDAETDAALKERYFLSFRSGGGSSVEAMRAVLLNLDGVTQALVYENASDAIDSDGRPPHSVEAIVRGGLDQEIIDAIWVSKAAGILAYGINVSGFATDSQGNPQAIDFTRPVEIPIYITVDYEASIDAPADLEDSIEAEILDYGTSLVNGQSVYTWKIKQRIETANIDDLDLRIGLSASPSFDLPITISPREIAAFDSTRIVFNRTN